MKLTTRLLKKIIKEEYDKVVENQEEFGLSHNFSDKDLIKATEEFSKNYTPEDKKKGMRLLKTLTRRIQKAVSHETGTRWDVDEPKDPTSDEETKDMKTKQKKLKAAKEKLLKTLGQYWSYKSNKERMAAISRSHKILSRIRSEPEF
tara:strand:+ start:53 stop:493 length:441 start_codon:yes stop_codon:yes gene_type:complete